MRKKQSSTSDAVEILWEQPMYGVPRRKYKIDMTKQACIVKADQIVITVMNQVIPAQTV